MFKPLQILELGLVLPMNEKQYLKFLPNKKVWLEDYKRWVDFSDKKIQNNLKLAYDSGKIFKPVMDKNHDYHENHAEFGEMEIREDGIYLETKLNELGLGLVKSGLYKYISPVIRDVVDTDGKKWENVLFALSLTNVPALMSELKTVKEQLSLTKKVEKKGEQRMNGIALELSLNPEASESAIVSAVRDIKLELSAKIKEAEEKGKEILKMAMLTDEQKKCIEELQAKFNGMVEEMLTAEADEVVEMAVKEGKLLPDEKSLKHYKDRYKKDKEAVKFELSLMKPLIDVQKTLTGTSNGVQTTGSLSLELSAYMDRLGWDKKDKESVEIARQHLIGAKETKGAK